MISILKPGNSTMIWANYYDSSQKPKSVCKVWPFSAYQFAS